MSRTKHHRHQNRQHPDENYMGRFRCNMGYESQYGRHGRNMAHKEMRQDEDRQIRSELSAGNNEIDAGYDEGSIQEG
jgi:hypothetical protein